MDQGNKIYKYDIFKYSYIKLTLFQLKCLRVEMRDLDTLLLGANVLAKVGYSSLFDTRGSAHFCLIKNIGKYFSIRMGNTDDDNSK